MARQKPDQPACCQVVRDYRQGRHDDAGPFQGCGAQRLAAVNPQAPPYRHSRITVRSVEAPQVRPVVEKSRHSCEARSVAAPGVPCAAR